MVRQLLLLTCLLFGLTISRANVIVRNINCTVDSTGAAATCSVDIDTNGVIDFTIYRTPGFNVPDVAIGGGANQWLSVYFDQPKAFQAGEAQGSATYANGSPTSMGNAFLTHFQGLGTRYIVVRFSRNGAMHYGWIEVEVSSTRFPIEVKRCAWNDIAGAALLPGATTAVARVSLQTNAWQCSASPGGLTINTDAPVEGLTLTVSDANGRLLLAQRNITHNGFTPLALPAGIYFATLSSERIRTGKRFTIAVY